MPILNKKIVLFNGPPGSGKDTMVASLVPYLNFQHCKFAAPIKRMAAGMLDVSLSEIERNKDRTESLLRHEHQGQMHDETIRQLLIALSEEFCKPRYGNDIFGRIAVREAGRSAHSLLLYSDCGFEPEVQHVIRAVGRSSCLLIRLHRDGCTYANDSRSYLPDGICPSVDIYNGDIVHNVAMRCLRMIVRHLKVDLLKEPVTWVK